MLERPTNLLFANTASFAVTPKRRALTRKARSSASAHSHKIGIIDINAKAGLLFALLQKVNRSQDRYKFYPVEAPVPMGLGMFSHELVEEVRKEREDIDDADQADIINNVLVDDFQPHLRAIRSTVAVDTLVGVVAPMLAWKQEDGRLRWNFFAVGDGSEVMVSTYDLRDFAVEAGRTFEASVAMLIMAQIWSLMFGIDYHDDCRSCLFDYCENRSDLANALREITIDADCLDRIPQDERVHVETCLRTIRDYRR